MILHFSSLVVASSLSALVPSSESLSPESRVTGGQEAKECGIPGVLSIETIPNGVASASLCTATLIHPRVILYAGHCGTINTMTPGERWQQEKLTKEAFEMSKPHPAGNTGAGSPNSAMDWAVAVLKEPLKGVPVIPIAYGCELDMLIAQGKPVTLAGYADNAVGKQSDKIKDYYLKWANTIIGGVTGTTLKTTAGTNKVTACRGDSGGPMLARVKDGSWRTIGIASSLGPTSSSGCGSAQGFNTYSKVRKELIEWIEAETKIDVTPCFDLDGKPTPSLACDRFMAFAEDPASPSAKWDNNCADAKQLPQKDACGIEDSGEKEPEPEPETTTGSGDGDSDSEGSSDGGGEPGDTDGDEPTPDETPSSEPSSTDEPSDKTPKDTPEGTPKDTPKEEEPETETSTPKASAEPSKPNASKNPDSGTSAGNQNNEGTSAGGGCRLSPASKDTWPFALWGVTLVGYWTRKRR